MPIIISVARFLIAPTTYKNTMNMLSSDCVFLTVKCFSLDSHLAVCCDFGYGKTNARRVGPGTGQRHRSLDRRGRFEQ